MRQEKTITLKDSGNDLTFKITQMSATEAERFIVKAGCLLVSTGVMSVDLGEFTGSNEIMSALATALTKGNALQKLGLIDTDKAFALIDGLYKNVQLISGKAAVQVTPQNIDGMVADLRTLFALQKEIIAFNFDFFSVSEPTPPTEAKAKAVTIRP